MDTRHSHPATLYPDRPTRDGPQPFVDAQSDQGWGFNSSLLRRFYVYLPHHDPRLERTSTAQRAQHANHALDRAVDLDSSLSAAQLKIQTLPAPVTVLAIGNLF